MAMFMALVGIITRSLRATPGRGVLLGTLLLWAAVSRGQAPGTMSDSARITWGAYVEPYYAYDLSRPASGDRPSFFYNHTRHNEVNVNLALVSVGYAADRVRAELGLMAGTYVAFNMAQEPAALRNIHRANAGIRLSKERDLWVDIGVFSSHIGAESAQGLDCMTLTRSLMAENSPYFEAGARVVYRPSERWLFSGLVLNGWQRIQRQAGNSAPAFGTQVQHTPTGSVVLNWSTFYGSDTPDSVGLWRFYNDLYATVHGTNESIALGFDMGLQQNAVDPGRTDGWFVMAGIYRRRIVKDWWGVGRMEYFLDDQGVLLPVEALVGVSLGVDHDISSMVRWRIEARLLGDTDEGFRDAEGGPGATNTAFTTSLCVRLR